MKKLITFGSGLKKLLMLEPENDKPRNDKSESVNYNNFILAWFSPLVVSIIYYILAWILPFALAVIGFGAEDHVRDALANLVPSPAFWTIALVCWWLGIAIRATFYFVIKQPYWITDARLSVPWTDYYASYDPVPDGRICADFEHKSKGFHAKEIQSWASSFFDHTEYFENQEQFVAPVTFEIIRHSRLSLHDIFNEDLEDLDEENHNPAWLTSARERRKELVAGLAMTKAVTGVALFVTLTLLALLGGQRWKDAIHLWFKTTKPHEALGWIDTVIGAIAATWFEFAPIIIILGYYLFETQLILKWRLKESAELLSRSECKTADQLNKYKGWRAFGWAFAAALFGKWAYESIGQADWAAAELLVSLYLPQAVVALVVISVINTVLAWLILWPNYAIDAIIQNGATLVLKDGLLLRRPPEKNSHLLELVLSDTISATTPDPSLVETLKRFGLVSETTDNTQRLFVPHSDDASSIVRRIIETFPVDLWKYATAERGRVA